MFLTFLFSVDFFFSFDVLQDSSQTNVANPVHDESLFHIFFFFCLFPPPPPPPPFSAYAYFCCLAIAVHDNFIISIKTNENIQNRDSCFDRRNFFLANQLNIPSQRKWETLIIIFFSPFFRNRINL